MFVHAYIYSCRMLWAVVKYGDRMRAFVDMGYSTIEDN